LPGGVFRESLSVIARLRKCAQRHIIPVKREDFQVWDLIVNADQTALLTCGDGNGLEVYSKPIPFMDFPVPGIRFYYADWVIHLPSEY
jgi:hypothetical protein